MIFIWCWDDDYNNIILLRIYETDNLFDCFNLMDSLGWWVKICRRPNEWESILIGEQITLEEFEHRISWTTCSDSILNHKLIQKLMDESNLILYHLTI